MKKSILALSVLSVLSFGASASPELGDGQLGFTAEDKVEFVNANTNMNLIVQRSADGSVKLIDGGTGQIYTYAQILDMTEEARKTAKNAAPSYDFKNGEMFDDAIKSRMNNEDKYEFTIEQKVSAINKLSTSSNEFFIQDGKLFVKSGKNGESREVSQDEIKLAKQLIVKEAQKRSEPIDGINPPATDLPNIPVTREEAIQYIVDGNVQVKNAKNLDKAVKFRMNNEDKYEFTAEQKVAAVNKLTGNDRYSVQTSADGSKHLIDNETGHAYTPEQAESMAKEARTKIIAEAQKRAETTPPEGSLPPVENPEQPPVIEPDNEAVKKAVQNLASHGYSSQANIDTNAANIDELFNITADLREDLELQGARNMAAISARAFTTEEGEFSVGVGLGGSGSENAMAIGGAYQINANWSVNTTIAFDTGSNADYGVGAHYSW